MVRLGGAASPTYISVFRGLRAHFRRHGIELDWTLYSDYDALVEAFLRREISSTMPSAKYSCSGSPLMHFQASLRLNPLAVLLDPVARPTV